MQKKQADSHKTKFNAQVTGQFVIKDVTDPNNPKILLDETNAIHSGNMAKHMAFAMAGADNHAVHSMVFGKSDTGTAFEDRTANVGRSPSSADTVNGRIYGAVVARFNDPDYSVFAKQFKDNYADIVTTCTIPMAVSAEGSSVDDAGTFMYDEIGILALNPESPENVFESVTHAGKSFAVPSGILLAHKLLENPITKMAGTAHQVSHTLRIRIQ